MREGPAGPGLQREAAIPPVAEIEAGFLLGLLRDRAALVAPGAKPEASLWPALNIGREAQPAGAGSKWFTRFLRKTVGIEDPTKVFHSFGTHSSRWPGMQGCMRRCTMPSPVTLEAVASGGATGEASGSRR